LNPGRRRGRPSFYGYSVDWSRIREDFLIYAKNYGYVSRTIKDFTSYLDRFVGERKIMDPRDVMEIFNGLSRGQVHHLDRALRALLNFYRDILGYPDDWVRRLKKAIPKDQVGIDINTPDEAEVFSSLVKIREINSNYRVLWLLLLESGVRLVEAVRMLNEFDERKLYYVNERYCRYSLGMFRGMKQAYYAYFSRNLLQKIQDLKGGKKFLFSPANASHYFSKHGILTPKYLRKFVFDKMTDLGIPESTADFIEGRVPKTIGARHYTLFVRKADRFYMRYYRYITKLEKRAKINEWDGEGS